MSWQKEHTRKLALNMREMCLRERTLKSSDLSGISNLVFSDDLESIELAIIILKQKLPTDELSKMSNM